MPVIDRCVVLQARIGALPTAAGYIRPEFAGLDRFYNITGGAAGKIPVPVVHHRPHKFIVYTQTVI